MKYLQQLPSKSQLEEFVSSLYYKEPSVIEIGNEIIYNCRKKFLDSLVFNPDDYLSIYALEDGAFTYATPSKQIEYSLNEGEWTVYSESVECNAGDIIRLRGNNTNYYYSGLNVFSYSGKFILYGNTDSLINSDKSDGFYVSSYTKNTFDSAFYDNYNLISIKYLTINANAQYSCRAMFYGCSKLVQILDHLPAPTSTYCYANMFQGCSLLQDASNLTINAANNYCCSYMFDGCTSLEKIPTINVVGTGSYMFQYMFYGCSSLKHAFDYFPDTGYGYAFRYMFADTSLKEAPKIRGVVRGYDFYSTFSNCNITNLPLDYFNEVTSISGNYSFAYMFQNCKNLKNSPIISTQSTYSYTYSDMFNGCTSLTIALPICDFNTPSYSFQRMFADCTSLMNGPVILANTVSNPSAFTSMFAGCSNLQHVGINLSKPDNNQSYSFPNWLQGTSPHGTIAVPFNSFVSGVNGLPEGWNVELYYPFTELSVFTNIYDLSLNSTGQEWYEFFDSLLNEYEYVYVVNSSSYKWWRVTKDTDNAIYMRPINGAVGNKIITSDYTIYDNNYWSQNIPVGFLALNEPLQSAVIHNIM